MRLRSKQINGLMWRCKSVIGVSVYGKHVPGGSPFRSATYDTGIDCGCCIGGCVADVYCSLARGKDLPQDEVQTFGVRFESCSVVSCNYCLEVRAPTQADQANFYRSPAFAGAERLGMP